MSPETTCACNYCLVGFLGGSFLGWFETVITSLKEITPIIQYTCTVNKTGLGMGNENNNL